MANKKARNFYTVEELAVELDGLITINHIREMLRQNRIPHVSFGNKKLIKASWLRGLLHGAGREIV